MRLARFIPGSTTLFHVAHIIRLCSGVEMCWITAWWIVALVKTFQTIGDSPIGKFVRKAMCIDFLSTNAEHAIAFWKAWAKPFPTFIGTTLIHLFPKSLLDRFAGAMTREIAQWFTLNPSIVNTVLSSKLCWLTTAALTDTAWVRRLDFNRKNAGIVTSNKANWLSFDPSFLSTILWGYAGFLSTTTLATTDWYICHGFNPPKRYDSTLGAACQVSGGMKCT